MGFNQPDNLLHAGFSAGAALAIQDQATEVGNSTPPSQGGTSMNPTGNIFTFFGSAGNGADTTEDTLKSFSLPANSLDKVGRGVYIYAWGTSAANSNTKAAKLYFGSESISCAPGSNQPWALEMVVGKTGSSTQTVNGQAIVNTTHEGTTVATGAETDTAAITIKVTGQDSTSATANSVVLNGMYIQFMN